MTDQNRPSRLARNAVANWIAFLFAAIVAFFLSPFVVQHLGATRYGVWSLLAGLVGYLGLLDLGIRQAVNRFVAHHQAVSAHEECSSIVSAAMRLFGFLGLLAIVLSGVLAYFAPLLFNIPESLVGDTRIIVVLGGLTVAVTLIGGVSGGVVSGLQRFDVQCGIEIILTTFRSVAIVIALLKGYSLVAMACILLAASVLSWLMYWVAVHKLYRELRFRIRGSLFPQMRTILSFGVSTIAIYVCGLLISYSDSVIIAVFLPIEAVTYFAIAGNLWLQANGVTTSLAHVMTPRVSALASMGSNRVGGEILAVARIATVIVAPIAATFVVRGESFINLWMGPMYGPASGEILRILAIVLWLGASRSVVIFSLTGMAKQRMLIPVVAVEAACKVALSVVLVRPLGILGVALGTLIPSVLMNLGYIPRCLSKAAGVPIGLFHQKSVLLPTAACIPFAIASAVIERFIPATNLAVFFVQVLLILPLVPVTAWFLCLTASEQQQVKTALKRLLRS